ncbi:MAG: hypothetical protein J6O17_02400 [Eubacterium sp.]|nr:hypothetical protein [Eubacterium sp.]
MTEKVTEAVTEAATEAPKENVDSELYDSFSNNEAKVLYRGGEGIRTATLFPLGQALEEGQSYTINQIVFLLKNLPSIPDTFEPDIKYERIDCGQDGVQELLVDMISGSSEMYMIIKDIDGELVLCYAEEFTNSKDASPHYIEYKLNPDCTTSRIMSEGKVDMTEYAIIDGNGDYHLYYGLKKTTTFYTTCYVKNGDNSIEVSPDGLDSEHIVLYDYYFSDDEHFMSYSMIDDNGNDITTDADYEDSNAIKKRFAESGVKTYSNKEIEEMLSERAKEIGYPAK